MILYQIFAFGVGAVSIFSGDSVLGQHWMMTAYLLTAIRWAVTEIQSRAHLKQEGGDA